MTEFLTTTPQYVNASESAVIEAELYDAKGETLDKAAILTLTLTIHDEDGNVINGRSNQSIKDTNGGTIATDGTVEITLSPADNAYQKLTGFEEIHYAQVTWTYRDAASNTQTGKHDWGIHIQKMEA